MVGDGGAVSDYSRGKRLRKLARLLSSKAATQVSGRSVIDLVRKRLQPLALSPQTPCCNDKKTVDAINLHGSIA
jgi:hypothetical protein